MTGLSRGQFLKGVGGAVVAISLLSGTSNFASAAVVQPGPAEGLKSIGRKDLRGKELIELSKEVAQRSDVTNVMGRAWATSIRSGRAASVAEDGGQVVLVEEGGQSSARTNDHTSGGTAQVEIKAARHELENGAAMLAVGYKLPDDDKFVLYYEFEEPIPDGAGELKSRAALHAVEGEELVVDSLSMNGGPVLLLTSESLSTTSVRCGKCYTTYRYKSRACIRQKWGCLLVACAACIPACATIIGCLYCAGVQCPYAYLYACCRRRGYVCPPCRG